MHRRMSATTQTGREIDCSTIIYFANKECDSARHEHKYVKTGHTFMIEVGIISAIMLASCMFGCFISVIDMLLAYEYNSDMKMRDCALDPQIETLTTTISTDLKEKTRDFGQIFYV